jgi:CRP/FNR family cyclic AMP-dependent transcriptional regulator
VKQGNRPTDVGFVLDIDPELGADIGDDEWERARHASRGRLIGLPPGACDFGQLLSNRAGLLGYVIVDGIVCKEFKLRDRHLIELLGPGDIVQPPARDDDLPAEPKTTLMADTIVLALGATFLTAAARWPGLLSRVLERIERQHERMAAQQLIVHLPLAKDRLLLMIRHLGTRWGQVRPDGIHLPLRLTHDVLGQLIAARRSTVTLAVHELVSEGSVRRSEDDAWVLTPHGQKAARAVGMTDPTRTLGESLLLRQQTGELVRDFRALRASARQARAQHHRIP